VKKKGKMKSQKVTKHKKNDRWGTVFLKIQKICVYLRPNSGFGILGLGLKKQTKIGCVGWLSALGVLCVRIICWVGSGFKQQKTLCLRGLRVRKMVVWDGV